MLHILEEGFLSADQYKVHFPSPLQRFVVVHYIKLWALADVLLPVCIHQALGRERAVPLSNSLSMADTLRLEHALRQDPRSLPLPYTQGGCPLCNKWTAFIQCFYNQWPLKVPNIHPFIYTFRTASGQPACPEAIRGRGLAQGHLNTQARTRRGSNQEPFWLPGNPLYLRAKCRPDLWFCISAECNRRGFCL